MPRRPGLLLLLLIGLSVLAAASGSGQLGPCPSFCFCDEASLYVSCVGDGLWELPSEVPKGALRLEFRNFAVTQLRGSMLEGFENLKELVIQRAQIQRIENGTFSAMVRLEHLDLSQNRLENVSRATFEGSNALRHLDLSSNRLSWLDDAFMDLNNVEQLNLRDNCLPSLMALSFQGLQKVQYLNLDSNSIASIDVGTFQDLVSLAHLILSNNPLVQLARLDFFGSRLQFLDMSHVGLIRVPQSLTRFVRDLRLAKNNLTEIRRGDFDSYPNIGLLVLDDNSITEIEDDALGRLEFLQRLWLNGNKLSSVPQNLPPSLKALYMEENLLQSLRSHEFRGLNMLEQLFLQRNQIQELATCAFCDLVSLRNLDLQANLMETIPEGAFANLTSLETLDLSQNPLRTIAGTSFSDFTSLKVLQLSRLKYPVTFDETLFDPLQRLEILEVYNSPFFAQNLVQSARALHGLRNIRELNLMHNHLETLRSDFPKFFPQLRMAKMSNNEWDCRNHTLHWLAQWILHSNVQFFKASRVTCVKPEPWKGLPVFVFHDNEYAKTSTNVIPTHKTTTTPIPPTLQTAKATDSHVSTAIVRPPMSTTINPVTSTQHPVTTMLSAEDGTESTDMSTSPTEPGSSETLPTMTMEEAWTSEVTPMFTDHPDETKLVDLEGPTSTKWVDTTSATITTTTFLYTTIPITPFPSTPPSAVKVDYSYKTALYTSSTAPPSKKPVSRKLPFPKTITKPPNTKPPRKVQKDLETSTIYQKHHHHPNDHSHHVLQGSVPTASVNPEEEGVTSAVHEPILVVATSVAISLGLLLLGMGLGLYRYRKRAGKCGSMLSLFSCRKRRGSSISYLPQRDEVHIVTVSDGSVTVHTDSHHGLENKLYFSMEGQPAQHSNPPFAHCDFRDFEDLQGPL